MNRLLVILFSLVGVLAVTVVAGFLWLLSLEHAIQKDRRDSIIASCVDQNHRHDKTIAQLNKAKAGADAKFAKAHPGAANRAARLAHAASTAAGVATFALIFNASTPHRDCSALVAKYVTH